MHYTLSSILTPDNTRMTSGFEEEAGNAGQKIQGKGRKRDKNNEDQAGMKHLWRDQIKQEEEE
jgi:hypothetical protein